MKKGHSVSIPPTDDGTLTPEMVEACVMCNKATASRWIN